MPAHSTRKYEPGGPTRRARHSPALIIARRIAATANAGVEPAVNAPNAVEATSPRPIAATVVARRRRGAAGA